MLRSQIIILNKPKYPKKKKQNNQQTNNLDLMCRMLLKYCKLKQ